MFLERMTDFLKKSIYAIYILLFFWTLYVLIFIDKSIEYFCGNIVGVPNFILTIIIIIFLSLYIFKLYKIQFKNRYDIKKILMLLSLILFILQLFLIFNITFRTGWDVSVIDYISNKLVLNPNGEFSMDYFQTYSNNVVMLAIYVMVKRVGFFLSLPGHGLLLLLGGVITNISVFLTSLTVYKVTDNKNLTLFTFIIAALLFGLSPWIVIPYSDVYSLMFPILTLFLYISLKGNKYPRGLMWFLIFLVPFVGYVIKPQNIIVLIAIIIIELLNITKDKITIRNIAMTLGILLLSFGSMMSLTELAFRYTNISPNDELKFPMHHWAMMGLNERTNGVYADEDVEFTLSFSGIEEKKEQNMLEIRNRLKNMGLSGFRDHMTKKQLTNYNDGTFAWGIEGNFYADVSPDRIPVVSSFMRNIYYNHGNLFKYFATFQQTIWMMVLLLCLVSGIIGSKMIDKKMEQIVFLSLIGVTLFSLIFEARARYLFLYLPFYTLCASIGLSKLQHKMKASLS